MSSPSAVIGARNAPWGAPMLIAGALSGPVFYGLVVAQIILRPGFDFMHHPLSLLSLGEGGWVQRTAFVLAGLLVLAGVTGMRLSMPKGRARTWVIGLVSAFGLGTLFAGLFVPDPAFGFPPGSPDGAPATMTIHSMLHGICFDLAFLALIVAMFVFGFASRRSDRSWAWFSFGVGIAVPILIVAGLLAPASMGASFFGAGVLAFGWVGTTFLHALSKNDT